MCAGAISNFHKVYIKFLSAKDLSTLMDIQPLFTILLECYGIHNIDFSDSNTYHASSENRAPAKDHKRLS